MTTVSTMPPGTIVTYRGKIVRRRPHATAGLPWKSFYGTRFSDDEVAAMVAAGAVVSFCDKCAVRSCPAHDRYWFKR